MSISKTFGALTLGAMGLINAADATAQETKTPPKQEPAKVVKFIANEGSDATLVSKSTNAELTGRARVEADNSNKITQQDTPLAETIEAIAAEVKEYGLLQTRQEKLDFAKKIQASITSAEAKDHKYAQNVDESFLKGLKWLKGDKSNKYFDDGTVSKGFTKERYVAALINSPSFDESYGSMSALAKGKTSADEVILHNERLITESKVANQQSNSQNRLVNNLRE